MPSCSCRPIGYVWLAKYQPGSFDAANELWVPGKITLLSGREHNVDDPLHERTGAVGCGAAPHAVQTSISRVISAVAATTGLCAGEAVVIASLG